MIVDIASRSHVPLPLPSGPFKFIQPRVMIRRDGSILALWGEMTTDSGLKATDASWKPKSVWGANFVQGRWRNIARIATADGINWDGIGASEFAESPDASIHLIVPAFRHMLPGMILHVALIGDRWVTDEIQLRTEAAYTALVATQAGLLAAVIAPVSDRTPDVNSVWTLPIPNGARPGKLELVSRSGDKAARDPRFVREAHGDLVLLWAQPYQAGSMPTAIREVRSSNNGSTWSSPVDDVPRIPPLELVSAFPEAISAAGGLYIAA
ncbi:MAG TPA: hypothetical protein VII52_08680, partial [Gemmatimonadaceae bacterium]